MKTKIQILIAMFFFGSVIGLSAQDGAKSKAMEHAKKKTAQLDQYLDLNDEQTARIERINRSYYDRRAQIFEGDLNDSERNERVRGHLTQYKNDVRAVLTPEQQQKFDAKVDDLTKDMAEKMEKHKANKNDQRGMEQ